MSKRPPKKIRVNGRTYVKASEIDTIRARAQVLPVLASKYDVAANGIRQALAAFDAFEKVAKGAEDTLSTDVVTSMLHNVNFMRKSIASFPGELEKVSTTLRGVAKKDLATVKAHK